VWPEPVERVARELRAAAVEATVQEFPEGTPTAEAAANAVGCRIDQILKSLVFVADGAYVLAMVPGDRRADESRVAEATGATEVRVARGNEVFEATGFEPGGVAPFPLTGVQEVFIERTLMQHERVWIGAGSPTHMAALGPTELQRLSGARAADLVGPR